MQGPLRDFWETSIPSILKSAPRLTSLTLITDEAVGVFPAAPLTNIHFSALTSLSLYGLVLDAASRDTDLLEFIIRHKTTLAHLQLVECTVYGGETRTYLRPWHAVLRRLRQELLHLRSFRMGPVRTNDDYSSYSPPQRFRYLSVLPGRFYIVADEMGTEADSASLQSLLSTVESRRSLNV